MMPPPDVGPTGIRTHTLEQSADVQIANVSFWRSANAALTTEMKVRCCHVLKSERMSAKAETESDGLTLQVVLNDLFADSRRCPHTS